MDAFLADHSILNGYKKDDRLILSPGFAPQDYVVCAKAGSSLGERVNEAVRARLQDGTVDALIEKWGNET